MLDRLDNFIKRWLVRLILYECILLLCVHVLCMYCLYEWAVGLITISVFPILMVATYPKVLATVFVAEAIKSTGESFFWDRADPKGSLIDQYFRTLKLAIALHVAVGLRIVVSPITSGVFESASPLLTLAVGLYAISKMLEQGFSESVRQFTVTTLALGIVFAVSGLFPKDTPVGYTMAYLKGRDCPCDDTRMKFSSRRDINPVCMFNPYTERAKIVVGQDSRYFDSLVRAPVQCRPKGIPHEGFDYERQSTCYSGYAREASNSPERMVPFSREDEIRLNQYIRLQLWLQELTGADATEARLD